MENTNFQYAFTPSNADLGNLRETFFINQVGHAHSVEFIDKGDFRVNRLYSFEVRGKNKPSIQIHGVKNSFIAADDIEYGTDKKIPLWMFGFLY